MKAQILCVRGPKNLVKAYYGKPPCICSGEPILNDFVLFIVFKHIPIRTLELYWLLNTRQVS